MQFNISYSQKLPGFQNSFLDLGHGLRGQLSQIIRLKLWAGFDLYQENVSANDIWPTWNLFRLCPADFITKRCPKPSRSCQRAQAPGLSSGWIKVGNKMTLEASRDIAKLHHFHFVTGKTDGQGCANLCRANSIALLYHILLCGCFKPILILSRAKRIIWWQNLNLYHIKVPFFRKALFPDILQLRCSYRLP